MGYVMIDKLAPLHEHQSPDVALTRPVTELGQRLGDQPGAGQWEVSFPDSGTVHTWSAIA